MQKGSIKQNGNWWTLKYRGDVVENGVLIKGKDLYHKLAPIDREHSEKKDGTAPNSVLALRDQFMAEKNLDKSGPQNLDTFQSYLESYLKEGIGPQGAWRKVTQDGYYVCFRAILPHIPTGLKLKDVDVPAVHKMLRSLYAADNNGDRSQTAYNNIKSFLSSACKMAAVNGLIKFNPVSSVPSLHGNDSDTHAYSLQEVHDLIDAVKAENNQEEIADALTTSKVKHALNSMEAAFTVAAFTGLRKEEIQGLRWSDYKDGLLYINRTVVERVIADTKTRASKAPVPVVGIVKAALDKHLKTNSGTGYIFHKDGDSETPVILDNYIRNHARPILDRKDVKWHGMHAFRRGLATVLDGMEGIENRTVSHVLRHEIKTDDVAGSKYIKRDIEKVRRVLERVEVEYRKLA